MKKKAHIAVAILVIFIALFCFAQDLIAEGARTSVTLRSNHNISTTKPADVITLSGELIPRPFPPASRLLQISVQHPDGTYAYNDGLWTDDQGNYELEITVNQPGYMRAEVRFLGNLDYEGSYSEMIIPIAPEIGMVIVVAGGGFGSPFFPSAEAIADKAVRTFRGLNIPDDPTVLERNRIMYLHPDTSHDSDGDGQPDGVDDVPTLANLAWAIETWAAELIQTKDDYGNWLPDAVLNTPLTVYLIGDAVNGRFLLNSDESIDGATLDNYLDTLEQSILDQFFSAGVDPLPYLPINVILECPFGGDFIVPLSQLGRVVISSTTPSVCDNPRPELCGVNYMALSLGSVSFSSYFLSRIASGGYIHPSFAYAELNILSNSALVGQEPQLEATGEGIPNEDADARWTASMPLEYRHRPIADARPRLLNGLGTYTLRRDESSLNLWRFVDDPENNLEAVEVVITPPSESFEETHVIQMYENLYRPGRYEREYSRFYGEGLYTLVYTATDEAGNVANPGVKYVIVYDTLPPEDVTNLRVMDADSGDKVLRWYPSASNDSQGYRIYVTPPNEQEFLWRDVGNFDGVSIPGQDIFGTPGIYTFRVTAYDRVPLESHGISVVFGTENQPPMAFSQEFIIDEDTSVEITLEGSDPEDDELTFIIVDYPTNGSLSGEVPDLTYSPDDNFHGVDSFTFKVNDGGADSEVASINITINPVNDSPMLTNNTGITVDEVDSGDILSTALLVEDVDNTPDEVIFTITAAPTHGSLELSGYPIGSGDTFSQVDINNVLLSYVHDGSETISDSFDFNAGDGTTTLAGQTFNIMINPVNDPPIANAGPDQVVERNSVEGALMQLNGSASYDIDSETPTYEWTWNGETATGINPMVVLPPGPTTVTLTVFDDELSDTDTVDILVEDTTAPEVNIVVPYEGAALQDGVTFEAGVIDFSEITHVYYYVSEPGDPNGVPIGYEDLPAIFDTETGTWKYDFDTTQVQDGYYVILAKAIDYYGNVGWSEVTAFSIRNWAVVELLPATQRNKAGRTIPVKFALRIAEVVDPLQPLVYNEELEIKIYNMANSGKLLQTSHYGTKSKDYRINSLNELYITNFKTSKKLAEYMVEIWRLSKDWKIGEFTFETVK